MKNFPHQRKIQKELHQFKFAEIVKGKVKHKISIVATGFKEAKMLLKENYPEYYLKVKRI